MREVETTKGVWRVTGITNLIPSDSAYELLQNAIETDKLDQTHLQGITGHRAPIEVDEKNKVIHFYSW